MNPLDARRRICLAALVVALIFVPKPALAGEPVNASAGEPETQAPVLLLSLDGHHYADSLEKPLFQPIEGYIPGSRTSTSLWVRNSNMKDALLSVAAVTGRTDPELGEGLGLTILSENNVSARKPLDSTGSCADLALGWPLPAGESIRLDLTLDLDIDAPNAVRRQQAVFDVRVLLHGTGTLRPLAACTGGRGTLVPGTPKNETPVPATRDGGGLEQSNPAEGFLPDTGASKLGSWLLAGLGAVITGAGIVTTVRGRRPNENA